MTAADDGTPPAGRDDGALSDLSDPRAIRALAHPARVVVLERLLAGAVLTATECAQIAGLTPSAMSYHLRALEKDGLVGRAEAGADRRERPWLALGPGRRVGAVSQTLRGTTTSSHPPVDLTLDEVRSVNDAVEALLAGLRDRPRPASAVRYHLWWATVPRPAAAERGAVHEAGPAQAADGDP